MPPLIKLKSKGPDVKKWQEFLISQGLLKKPADSDFGPDTFAASEAFQNSHGLPVDGVVGDNTYNAAIALGFNASAVAPLPANPHAGDASWPPKPAFQPLVSNAQRQALFGTFTYVASPQPGDAEHIKITNGWDKQNITMVTIPQLKAVNGGSRMEFHKAGSGQLVKLWAAWEAAGLLPLILTYDGSYNPRFIRGSKTILSNHSFGTAFDINVKWNDLKKVPALAGEKGSVRDLVGIANDHGFYWGGHFNRLDGMHFEVAKII